MHPSQEEKAFFALATSAPMFCRFHSETGGAMVSDEYGSPPRCEFGIQIFKSSASNESGEWEVAGKLECSLAGWDKGRAGK
jgi:hypothetical protein